jgi:hypothetical protein
LRRQRLKARGSSPNSELPTPGGYSAGSFSRSSLYLLWLDPAPKLFMGDSWSYISTGLTGWIPGDRSYFYGYLVRWLAVWPHSFTPLLVVQALASGATAILFALICSRFFEMSNTVSFLFGSLCAVDPCQLVWEVRDDRDL